MKNDSKKGATFSIAFQGEPGAYSEEAAAQFFGRGVTTKPHRGLEEVFDGVVSGKVDRAIVPVENSLEGSVNETYDLLRATDAYVLGEVNLRVRHCLISHHGSTVKQLRIVYSHPQALGQCTRYLKKIGVETVPTYDTAGSVKMLKSMGRKGVGAIASRRAAEIYGAKVIAEGIEDQTNNYTRFFILSKKDHPRTRNDKTSVIFGLKHDPGALYHAIGEFAQRTINLTKIESRPTRERPWEYNFYLDFEGHRKDAACASALQALKKSASFVRILGSYPRAQEPA